MTGKLTDDHLKFLQKVKSGALGMCVDRAQDRIRQHCRREGLVEYAGRPKRWCLTPTGLAALQETKT